MNSISRKDLDRLASMVSITLGQYGTFQVEAGSATYGRAWKLMQVIQGIQEDVVLTAPSKRALYHAMQSMVTGILLARKFGGH